MKGVSDFLRAQLIWVILIAVAVIGGLGYVWYQQQQAAQARADELAALRTEPVTRGNLMASVSATGALFPNRQANLFFLTSGTVKEVLVKPGEAVKTGQVLVRLDDADLQLAIAQAEDAVQITELRRKKLLTGPTEDDIAVAKANLRAANATAADASRGLGQQEVSISQLKYDQAAEDFRKQQEQYENLRQFARDHPRFAPPQSTLDSLKSNLENTYYQAEIARLQLQQTKRQGDPGAVTVAYARIAQAKAQLDQLMARPTEAQIQQADLAVEQARLALEQAQQRAAKVELRAPFDGVIAVVNPRVSEPVSTTSPAVVLLDISQFLVDVTVNEVDVAQLAVDQPVNISVEALPDTSLTGKVSRIAPVGAVQGGAVNYTVRVALDQIESELRVGMSATVQVTVAEVQSVILAPNWAISRNRRTGQAFLSLRVGDELKEVPIETGLRGEIYTEIKSGAQEGDEAAISTKRENLFGDGN